MQITRGQLFFTLAVLLSINTLNFFDRQVPGAVGEPIKTQFKLTDRELGAINTAFVLLYAAVGMPLGHWTDVGRRKVILTAGITVWSLFTVLSGFAQGFWSLFALRLGVGVGEASCAPAGNALLGDLFPRERRGRAIAIFMLGLPLGLGFSSFVSGSIAKHFASDELGTDGWRYAFFVAGLPGFVLALLCLALPEPARGAAEALGTELTPPRERHWTVLLRIPTLWWIVISGALHNFNMYAIGAFLASLLMRYYGQGIQAANNIMGVVYCVGGLGILLGGWACDWMVRRRVSGRLEVSTLALAVGSPCVFLALRQPAEAVPVFMALLLPGCLLFYVYYAAIYSTIQDIVEPALRGKAMALYFFAMYYLGGAGGPYIIGWLSDMRARVAAGATEVSREHAAVGLHDALYLVPILGGLLVLVLFAASRTVTRDYERLHVRMAEESAAGRKKPA